MKLIDADKLFDRLRQEKLSLCSSPSEFRSLPQTEKSRIDELEVCMSIVANMALERPKTGKWIRKKNEDGFDCIECSSCGTQLIGSAEPKFCLECGADMRPKTGRYPFGNVI